MTPKYSVIIPVYNRPEEVREILQSLTTQSFKNFEVIIVEDGSSKTCVSEVEEFKSSLDIHYFFKPNSGPGPARNFGFARARGSYFVIFDSDCIIPEHYFGHVEHALEVNRLDAWGGPDRAHREFTILQRAMGYTMSSFLTTGGIRGGKHHVGWFQPRSFNMGISRDVFTVTGGFNFDRYAEDIEFSIRMKYSGFRVGLVEEAFVYHKRRTTLGQFFKQVFNFGKGRVLVGKVHPAEVKLTHWIPTFFVFCCLGLLISPLIHPALFTTAGILFGAYLGAIFLHALVTQRHFTVALLSVPSALVQLWGYGLGFLSAKLRN